MRPAIVSGVVTGHAPFSYWPILFLVPSNNPRSLCESELGPVSLSILKLRIGWSGCSEENGAQLFFSLAKQNVSYAGYTRAFRQICVRANPLITNFT